MYVPFYNNDSRGISGRTLLKNIEAACKGFHELVATQVTYSRKKSSRSLGKAPEDKEQAINVIDSVILKDLLAYIKPFNSDLTVNHLDNYYMEREWRKYGNLKFKQQDIITIMVAKGFSSRIEKRYPFFKNKIIEV